MGITPTSVSVPQDYSCVSHLWCFHHASKISLFVLNSLQRLFNFFYPQSSVNGLHVYNVLKYKIVSDPWFFPLPQMWCSLEHWNPINSMTNIVLTLLSTIVNTIVHTIIIYCRENCFGHWIGLFLLSLCISNYLHT